MNTDINNNNTETTNSSLSQLVSFAAKTMEKPKRGAFCFGNTYYTRTLFKKTKGEINYNNNQADSAFEEGYLDRIHESLFTGIENNKTYALSDCKNAGDSFVFVKKCGAGTETYLFLKSDMGVCSAAVYLENAPEDEGRKLCAFLMYVLSEPGSDLDFKSAVGQFCLFKLHMTDIREFKNIVTTYKHIQLKKHPEAAYVQRISGTDDTP
ncbi:MAG: hypothetical protein K5848_00885 [Lachnospiraceae bacterium]|nr:hypothetical protein [Lachnospiraceae bacterium]